MKWSVLLVALPFLMGCEDLLLGGTLATGTALVAAAQYTQLQRDMIKLCTESYADRKCECLRELNFSYPVPPECAQDGGVK